jgi:hypothetical protein
MRGARAAAPAPRAPHPRQPPGSRWAPGTRRCSCRTGPRLLGCAPAPQTPCHRVQDWPPGPAPTAMAHPGLRTKSAGGLAENLGRRMQDGWWAATGEGWRGPRALGSRATGQRHLGCERCASDQLVRAAGRTVDNPRRWTVGWRQIRRELAPGRRGVGNRLVRARIRERGGPVGGSLLASWSASAGAGHPGLPRALPWMGAHGRTHSAGRCARCSIDPPG